MDVTNLLLAIEALGFDEESIDIRKHMEHHNNILRDTFHRTTLTFFEGAGSKFEGLEFGLYGRENFGSYTDMDVVYNFPVKPECKIVTCWNFPGYVYLLDSNMIKIPNIVLKKKYVFTEKSEEIKTVGTTQNGPACTEYLDFGGLPTIGKYDTVICLSFKSWPIEASKWAKRNRPHKWPSKELIETIISTGFNLAPVGHYDSSEKEFQWRIGILGEKELLLKLNQTQKLCYIALKMILKGDVLQIHEDILSSFHMKNLIFWCAEQEPCQWTKENFEICLKTCLNRLIKYITNKQFPHYFIEDRNLINSKMTFELKEQIVKALTKYSDNIFAILSLRIFDTLKERTNLKVEFLDCLKQKSIIESCILFYLEPFSYFYGEPNYLWQTYERHDTEINLKNAQGILSILNEKKMHFIRHHIAYAKSMLGFLCYSRYNKTHCQKDVLEARKLLECSLTFENISLKFRFATFLFMENDFNKCMDVCRAFFGNPNKYKSLDEKVLHAQMVVSVIRSLIEINPENIIELKQLKHKIKTIFYDTLISEQCGDGRLQAAETVLSKTMISLEPSKDIDNELVASNLLTLLMNLIEINTDNIIELTQLKQKIKAIFYDSLISEQCGDGRLQAAEMVLSKTWTLLERSKDIDNELVASNLLTLLMSLHRSLLLVFENFANLVFRDMSVNVPYLAAEKWAVPDVFQYELLSVQKCHPESHVYGIYIDPMLNCLVLTFLCCQKTNNSKQMDEMLRKMDNYVKEHRSSKQCCTFTKSGQRVPAELPHSLPLYRLYNIVAYCCFKAGGYKHGLYYILNSYKLYRKRKNTAYGYIKCVCGILNRLYVN